MRDLRASSSGLELGGGVSSFVAAGVGVGAAGLGVEVVVLGRAEVELGACDVGSLFSFLGRLRCRVGPAAAASFGGGVAAAFVTGFELMFGFWSCSSTIPPAEPARPAVFSSTATFRDLASFGGDVVGFGPGDCGFVGIEDNRRAWRRKGID
jgi:hypothetical protein